MRLAYHFCQCHGNVRPNGRAVPSSLGQPGTQGLGELSASLGLLRRYRVNPDIAIAGVVAPMATRRLVLEREVLEAAAALEVPLFEAQIPRSVRFAEAPAHGLPLVRWLPEHPGARAYRRLAEEVQGVRLPA